jgi:hypothetical protein
LRKYCEQCQDVKGWDEGVFWIALGYRCSKQASTGYSPYELMYARRPVIPPTIWQAVDAPLSFDDPVAASASVLQRAQHVQRVCPEAFGNLLIAQHRDSLRYAMVRSGSFQPTLVKFFPGQFVYVARPAPSNTLQVKARPEILRVVAVNSSGAVTLQGKCGTTIQQNVENLAPCFLPNIDPTVDPTLGHVPGSHPCEVCRFVNRPGKMLLCDNCNTGWHIDCLTPKLPSVPVGAWACPYCVSAGVDLSQLAARQAANQLARESAPVDIAPMFSINRRRLVAESEAMHNRWLIYPLSGPGRTKVPTWGLVEYLGEREYPRCLRVHYPNGKQHDVTIRLVRKYVQGVNSQPPADVLAAVPSLVVQNAATSLHTNPPSVSLVSAQSALPLVAGPLCVLDLQSLARVINMQAVHTLVDPIGCGLASLLAQLSALVLSQRAYTAATASIYGSSQRRIPPTPQLSLAQSGGDMAVLSLSLPVTLSGLLHLAACAPCVCIKLPGVVLHDLPLDVQRWVQQLQQQHRLQVIMGYSQPSGLAFAPHVCLWLCIFNSAAMRNTLVLPHQLTSTGLSVVDGCESGHSPGHSPGRVCF